MKRAGKTAKRKIILVSIIFLFFVVLPGLLFSINSKAYEFKSLRFEFEGNMSTDEASPTLYSNVNRVQNYSGHYEGTYSFEGETGETGTDISFVDSANLYDGECIIVDKFLNHKEVLRLQDDATAGEDPTLSRSMTQATSGMVEFYIGSNDVSNDGYKIRFIEDLAGIFEVHLRNSNLQYYNGAFNTIQAVSDDTWYHIKVQWYADNTFDVYLNGRLEVEGAASLNNQASGINKVEVVGRSDTTDYLYLDAWGEPNNDVDYNIGDNMFPTLQIEDNNTFEPSYVNYQYDEYHTLYSGAVPNDIPYWYEEEGTTDEADLSVNEYSGIYAMRLRADMDDTGVIRINRTYSIDSPIIDFSCKLGIGLLGNDTEGDDIAYFYIAFYNQSNLSPFSPRKYSQFRFASRGVSNQIINISHVYEESAFGAPDADITMLNQTALTYDSSDPFPEYYDVHIRFDNDTGITSLNFGGKTYYVGTDFVLADKVNILIGVAHGDWNHALAPTFEFSEMYIDEYSVRNDYKSLININNQIEAYPILSYNHSCCINVISNYNLQGNVSLFSFEYPYWSYGGTYSVIKNREYTDYSVSNYNLDLTYDNFGIQFNSTQLQLRFEPVLSNVSLVEGSNQWRMELNYSNLDFDNDYFYTNGSSLFAVLNENDTSTNSYLFGLFNVSSYTSTNYSLNTYVLKNNWEYMIQFGAYFEDKSEYTLTLEEDEDPLYLEFALSRELSPYKFLDYFTYNVSDSDLSQEGGKVIARFDPIILRYRLDLPIDPDDLHNTGLISMIIPILCIIIPTLSVSGYISGSDKEVGKMVFLPLATMFSFVFSVLGLVPSYIPFILILLTIGYIIMKRKRSNP